MKMLEELEEIDDDDELLIQKNLISKWKTKPNTKYSNIDDDVVSRD